MLFYRRFITAVCLGALLLLQMPAETLSKINSLRISRGLHPLFEDEAACIAAGEYAGEIAERMVLTHRGLDGSRVAMRYLKSGGTGISCGENLGAGDSFADILKGWFDSNSHCENMLNPEWFSGGLGFAGLPNGRMVAVLVLSDSRWQKTGVRASSDGENLIIEGRFYYDLERPVSDVFAVSGRSEILAEVLNRATPKEDDLPEGHKGKQNTLAYYSIRFTVPLPDNRSDFMTLLIGYTDFQGFQKQCDTLVIPL